MARPFSVDADDSAPSEISCWAGSSASMGSLAVETAEKKMSIRGSAWRPGLMLLSALRRAQQPGAAARGSLLVAARGRVRSTY